MLAKRIAKTVVFCAVLLFLINRVYGVLAWKDTAGDYDSSVNSFYDLDENVVDVLFMGSSHCYGSIVNAMLWEEYGIASFNIAISGQDLEATYYTLREALKTQSPKVVCIEMYYAALEGYQVKGNLYRNTLSLRMSLNSYEAVKNLVQEEDYMDYWLKWPIIHTRYAELQKEDFGVDRPAYLGYRAGFLANSIREIKPYDGEETLPPPEKNEKYIRLIMDLAKENDIELCFFLAPYAAEEWEQKVFRHVENMVRENGVDFINMIDRKTVLGMNENTDFIDYGHTNYYGAIKVTAYMGEYLNSTYELPDRRGSGAKYAVWDEDAEVRRHEVQNQQLFQKNADVDSYLRRIGAMEGYTFFVFTSGDYLSEDKDISESLSIAGIGEEFFNGCHVWVYEDGQLSYMTEGETFIHYEDLTYGEYAVVGTGQNPSLYIDGIQYGATANGINVVVYDNVLGEVVVSVGFDGLQEYAPVGL